MIIVFSTETTDTYKNNNIKNTFAIKNQDCTFLCTASKMGFYLAPFLFERRISISDLTDEVWCPLCMPSDIVV